VVSSASGFFDLVFRLAASLILRLFSFSFAFWSSYFSLRNDGRTFLVAGWSDYFIVVENVRVDAVVLEKDLEAFVNEERWNGEVGFEVAADFVSSTG
jgi:hypothetical protein